MKEYERVSSETSLTQRFDLILIEHVLS